MPAAKKTARTAPARSAVARKVAALPATPVAQAVKDVDVAKGDKAEKAKKPKLVRDSFTIPKNEFTVMEGLKLRAAKLGRPAKKSEVLRAGVMALAGMGDAAFLASVTSVPAVKTGRPAKSAA
jgi:deoxycytidine triphosphate deaminase